MDKQARNLSIIVAFLGLAFTAFIVRTTLRGGRTVFIPVVDSSAKRGEIEGSVLRGHLDIGEGEVPDVEGVVSAEPDSSPTARLRALREARRPISREELANETGLVTAFDAVRSLRPAWLSTGDSVVVRVGGVGLGGPEALTNIRIQVIGEIALVFTLDDPHWVIDVIMR
jgi:hypothetical protein